MTGVTLYGTQWCPFCRRAEQLLKGHVGGYDDLAALDHAGQLEALLQVAGANV